MELLLCPKVTWLTRVFEYRNLPFGEKILKLRQHRSDSMGLKKSASLEIAALFIRLLGERKSAGTLKLADFSSPLSRFLYCPSVNLCSFQHIIAYRVFFLVFFVIRARVTNFIIFYVSTSFNVSNAKMHYIIIAHLKICLLSGLKPYWTST